MSESIVVKMESLMNACNERIQEIDNKPMSEEYLQAMDKAKKKYEEKIGQIKAKAELDKANEKIAVKEDQIDKLKKMLMDHEIEMNKIIEEKDKQLKEKDDIIANLRNDVIPTKNKQIHELEETRNRYEKRVEYLMATAKEAEDRRRITFDFVDRLVSDRLEDMPADLIEPFRKQKELLAISRPTQEEWRNNRSHVDSIERIDNSTHVDVKEFSTHDVETLKDAKPTQAEWENSRSHVDSIERIDNSTHVDVKEFSAHDVETLKDARLEKNKNKNGEKNKNKNKNKRSGNSVNNNNASSNEARNPVNNNASSPEASKLINNASSNEASNPSNNNK